MAKYTEAQARAVKKYLEGQAEIKLRMLPVVKDQIKEYAQRQEKSINSFILDSVAAQIEKYEDGENIPDDVIKNTIEWLKNHGHDDSDIVDFLRSLSG